MRWKCTGESGSSTIQPYEVNIETHRRWLVVASMIQRNIPHCKNQGYMSSATSHQPTAISHQPSATSHQPSASLYPTNSYTSPQDVEHAANSAPRYCRQPWDCSIICHELGQQRRWQNSLQFIALLLYPRGEEILCSNPRDTAHCT